MPVLKGAIKISDGSMKVKILIDSGAAISLISKDTADRLVRAGAKIEREGNMRIKVASGERALINETLTLPIRLGGQWTNPIKFFILKNLPFEVLVGNPTLREWGAELSWETHRFSMRPKGATSDRLQVSWKNFSGQHWRKPVSLLLTDEVVLKPWTEAIVLVKAGEGESSRGTGLVTPIRSRQVFNCKFNTAYGYVEDGVEAIAIANATNKEVVLKKNRIVAEFHPRARDSFTALRCDREDGKQEENSFHNLSGGHSNRRRDAAPPERNGSEAACTLTMDHSGCCGGGGCSSSSSGSGLHDHGAGNDQAATDPAGRSIPKACSTGKVTRDSTERGSIGDTSPGLAMSAIMTPITPGLADRGHISPGLANKGVLTELKGTCCLGVIPDHNKGAIGREGNDNANVSAERSNNPTQSHAKNEGFVSKVDWSEFEHEPLKSVNLKELREQRSIEDVEKLALLLIRYKHLLSNGELDFRTNPNVKHDTQCTITTTTDNPKITARGTRCNPEETKVYMNEIAKKAQEGVIEPSRAPWCSNALLVRKDGKIRMVIDYRALNKITVKDSYPMPRIQDVTDVLQGTHWLTGMDCVQAFHQIPMADERSRNLTTFRGPSGGLYRYRYMPMGLVNAMAIWSRFIDTTMAGMDDFVLCYADDVLVFTKSSNVDDHIADLEKVFKQLEQNGIKIKASKLKLGLKLMPFLGVVITRKAWYQTRRKQPRSTSSSILPTSRNSAAY